MKLVNGLVFLWASTHASIPAGWSRVTDLDDKYPKGAAAAAGAGATGGAATHTHTSPAHTHNIDAHTHTITLAAATGGGASTDCNTTASTVGHTHAPFTSGAVASSSVSSVAATYASCSNHPPYSTVIYITPTTAVSVIPTGVIAFAKATPPSDFAICDGTSGTPNLVDKYLLGASTGADAGTTGGSLNNTHALSHTHTTSHIHSSATSGAETSDLGRSQSGTANVVWGHTHAVALNAATPSTVDNVTLNTVETVEPAYTKLLAVRAAANKEPFIGLICMWNGTLALIPKGFKLSDGTGGTIDMRDRHLKVTGTVGHVGNTGGSNTHTHAAQGHTHTGISHSHTAPNATHGGGSAVRGSGCATSTTAATIHTVSTSSDNMSLSSTDTTADSSSNEPPYRGMVFVELVQKFYNPAIIFLTS